MNTTLSGVETMVQQTTAIGSLLNSSTDLSSVISNAQGLSNAFSALESAQNTLKGYLDSSSATIGQLTNGSNAVVGALDKAIDQVDVALADLNTTDTQKTQAVTLATTGSSASSTTTDAINFLNALKANLTAQKDAFMNVHKNIQTAVAQAQATYKPSVMNTNNYGQMYGVDAMAGYKWFFGQTKRFGFRTYGYYSYNHANLSFVGSKLGIMEGASQVNNFAYGVGFDALYNFYESKEGYNTAGLFLGFGLGGIRSSCKERATWNLKCKFATTPPAVQRAWTRAISKCLWNLALGAISLNTAGLKWALNCLYLPTNSIKKGV